MRFDSQGFPCGSVGKESTCSAGNLGSIPGLGRSPGEGKDYPLQYFGLEKSPGLYRPWNSPGQNTGVGSLCLLQGIFPTQGSNPGLPHCRWILYQLIHKRSPRILQWVDYPFSSRSSWPRNSGSPALQADSLPTELSGKPLFHQNLGSNPSPYYLPALWFGSCPNSL